ncbi:hypothetical protein LUR56_04110 [Streptomyces sp. MT29]|nr:hypothetical protein [Streptomyces sp. MT29]
MHWSDFVRALESEVDWLSPDYAQTQSAVVEEILLLAARNRSIIEERTEQIASDDDLFGRLEPHMNYPRILMDKFVIHIDEQDRFRVRLHRFKSKKQNGGAVEKVHSHKWDCSTVILLGSYAERQFSVLNVDEERRTCKLDPLKTHTLGAGEVNSLATGTAHQVINESDDEACLTLFVRGPSRQPNAMIFDVDKGTYYNTYGPARQTKVGLRHIGRIDPNFH